MVRQKFTSVDRPPRFQFSVRTYLFCVLLLSCVTVFAFHRNKLPSVADRASDILQFQATNHGIEKIAWLSKISGTNLDNYKFQSRKNHSEVKLEIENLSFKSYKLAKNWYVADMGYTSLRTYFHEKTGQPLQVIISWDSVFKKNDIEFIFYKNLTADELRKLGEKLKRSVRWPRFRGGVNP